MLSHPIVKPRTKRFYNNVICSKIIECYNLIVLVLKKLNNFKILGPNYILFFDGLKNYKS